MALVLQLGFVTPGTVVAIWAIKRFHFDPSLTAFVIMSIMTFCTIALFSMSRAEQVASFSFVFVMFVLTANVMLALPFRWAVTYTLLFHLAIIPAIMLHPLIDLPMQVLTIAVNSSAALYSLVGNYKIETGLRTAYLFTLRESLRSDLLAEANVELRSLVNLDGLTRVANRRKFDEHLQSIWSEGKGPVALLMIDIDHFKSVNDTHGHLGGDLCLVEVGRRLTLELDGLDQMVARYGGEEFAVLLTETHIDSAAAVAERIRATIASSPVTLSQGTSIALTVSIGCACITPSPMLPIADLISAADTALYQAKHGGRNQVRLASLQGVSSNSAALVSELIKAG